MLNGVYSTFLYVTKSNCNCVTLNKNHIMWARRNGKTAWCGNCLHNTSPYIPNVSPKLDVSMDPAERALVKEHGYNKAQKIAYKAQSRQRSIERNVRGWKRREIISLDPIEKAKSHRKVLDWQGAQRRHIESNPFLPRKYEREGVTGWREAAYGKKDVG